MFHPRTLCIALIIAMPFARCDRDAQDCSQTKGPDLQIKGCTAIIDRGTGKDLVIAYNNRCFAYEIRGDHERAIADCEQAIKLDPKRAPAYMGRGLVYEDKGDHDRAITDYGKAIELDPKLAFVYGLRAIAYAKKGDKQHVIADFQKALTLDPGNEGFKKASSDIGKLP
jgi:tetratricopeptide (TPR) repeat protein